MISEVQSHLLKPVNKTYSFLKLCDHVENPATQVAFKNTNLFFKWFNVPNQINKLIHIQKNSVENIVNASKLSLGILGMFGATFKAAYQQKGLTLSATQLQIIDAIGFLSSITLIFKTLFDIKNILTKPSKSFGMTCLNLCLKICKLALGILGVWFFVFKSDLFWKTLILTISFTSFLISNYKNVLSRNLTE